MTALTRLTLPAVSRERLYFPGVVAFAAGAPDAANVTTLPVQMAFVAQGVDPAETDWKAGAWFNNTTTAYILIGPPGLILVVGQYEVWLRVLGASEQPERPLVLLTVS